MNRLLVLLVLCSFVSCSAVQRIPSRVPSGFVRVNIEPKDAIISVDDKLLGEVSRFESGRVRVRVGARRVKVEARGYFPQRFDLDVAENEEVTVTTVLDKNWDKWLKDQPKRKEFKRDR